MAGPEDARLGRMMARERQRHGFLASYHSWELILPAVIERLLAEHRDCVMSVGAGHTHYEDPALFARLERALGPFRNVVLLLPSPDPDRSVALLRERCVETRGTDWVHDGYDFLDHWVKDHCNRTLARATVYTEGRTPDETAGDVLRALALE